MISLFAVIINVLFDRGKLSLNIFSIFFNLFLSAVRHKDGHQILQSLYRWLDEIELEEPTITYFAKSYGSSKLIKEVNAIETNTSQFEIDKYN